MKLLSPNKDRTVLPTPGEAPVTPSSALSNEQIGAEFCDQIVDLSVKQAARIAHRTPAAVKKWRARANAPDSASLINVACNHDRTRAWLLWRLAGDASRLMDPRVLSELVAVLLRAAEAGDATARRILKEIHRAA